MVPPYCIEVDVSPVAVTVVCSRERGIGLINAVMPRETILKTFLSYQQSFLLLVDCWECELGINK